MPGRLLFSYKIVYSRELEATQLLPKLSLHFDGLYKYVASISREPRTPRGVKALGASSVA